MDIIGTIIGVLTILGIIEMRVKKLTKDYLVELKPNHGSSLKDKVDRLEGRLDDIYKHLLDK
jgi:hypothetical protein